MIKSAAFLLCLFLPAMVVAKDVGSNESGIWSIAPTEKMNRWVVIHNLEEAKVSGIYHLEVIGRNKGDAAWQIKHLVPHMAISKEALEKSIINPLKKGGVYPETYENAYSKWLKENNDKGGATCKTSILECM